MATEEVVSLAQRWIASEALSDSRLVLLTEGALAASEEESADPVQASIWGLLRAAASEHPGRFALIDTDGSDASAQALGQALIQDAESQLALREGTALCPRLTRAVGSEGRLAPPPGPWRLEATRRGTLESLALIPNPGVEEPLDPTEVRIQMRAAGLNFRDVLIALGLYPGEAPIGSEGAGVVVEVGSEVQDLSPGDPVMGLIGDSFAPLARVRRDFVAPMPEGWSFEQAAAVPIVFLTARYGLIDLAGLQADEKVLIHAGAGGVGTAAIQLARHIGAEVFATASPAKWGVLREMGIAEDHIASSRDLDFKDKFLKTTQGEGVDVVLNALAGEFVDASLDLLPKGGRFVEMGKTDIRDPEQVAADRPDVTYRAFDMLEAGPERIAQMLTETTALFEQGAFTLPPIATYDMREAPEAFRLLREGGNVGKLVLTAPQPLDPEKTTLITGGTGGLGALFARHLVQEQGAGHLLLVSRSGPEAAGAGELEAELTELGAKVTIAACDVADQEQLRALIEQIPDEHPLGAIVHAAGVLADATIESIAPEQIERVFAPKAKAAWNLHELSKDRELSSFVLFSSAAGVFGSPGQGTYAAANSFLDALAAERRAEGLPATSIAWGLWGTTSAMTAELGEADLARMRRSGIGALSEEQGLALFDAALGVSAPLTVALDLHPQGLRAMAQAGALPAIMSGLVRVPVRRRAAASARVATAPRRALGRGAARRRCAELVSGEVAAVLGHGSAADVDPTKAFQDLGFDSLAAVELRNRLAAATGMTLAPTLVFDYPDSAKLSRSPACRGDAATAASIALAVRATASDEPIAIVGIGCRYPGGVGSPRGTVGAGRRRLGRRSPIFPPIAAGTWSGSTTPTPTIPGTSYARERRLPRRRRRLRRRVLRHQPARGAGDGPPAAAAAGSVLGGAGGRRHRPRTSCAAARPASSREWCSSDYGGIEAMQGGYGLTGTANSVVSGRVAYALGLEGPAMTIDTACSSSLVAMHLAAQALREGECSLALAGGVTVLATPASFAEFSRQRGLAPDGRCKSFAEAADGIGLAEGVGVLALQRLSDAQRQGNPVLALLKGSAVNQDGASNGLTAPNGPSQERVIRQALANARLQPKDIDAVEAHGTGTTLGDPIEAGALLATYGKDRQEPLKLGSIKSNIGHTQAAAGVAGVIKMVMAMREGLLPKSLHIDQPSTKVDWSQGKVELLTEAEPWQPNGQAKASRRLLLWHQRHQRPRDLGGSAKGDFLRGDRRGAKAPQRPGPPVALGKDRAGAERGSSKARDPHRAQAQSFRSPTSPTPWQPPGLRSLSEQSSLERTKRS